MTAPRTAPTRVVHYHEVQHYQSDDYLHFEHIDVRGRLHDWTIPAHQHAGLHQIQYLAGGAVDAWIDDRHFRLEAPAVWMLAPGAVHRFVYQPGASGQQVTIPSAALVRALASTPQLAPGLNATRVLHREAILDDVPECAHLLALISGEFSQSRAGRPAALIGLAALLAMWVLRHGVAEPTALRRQAVRDALTHRYRSLVELHYRRRAPLAFYAGELGVTADHLSRVCRATTGLTALGLLHVRRLAEAKRQLAETDAKISGIASGLGFDDPAYFSRIFTHSIGKSPTDFRNGARDGMAVLPVAAGSVHPLRGPGS